MDDLEDTFKPRLDVPGVPLSSPQLNDLLGGKYPFGKYITLYSLEGLGKTTIALSCVLDLAQQGHRSIMLDTEGGVTDSLIDSMGMREAYDNHMFRVLCPRTFTDVDALLTQLIPHPEITNIVVDSITTILSARMATAKIEDVQVAEEARLQTQLVKKYKLACLENDTTIFWINQMRHKIGYVAPGGSNLEPAGCKALRFMSDITLTMRSTGFEKEKDSDSPDEKVIGRKLLIWAEKNKFTPPLVKYPLYLIYGQGLSGLRYIYDQLVQHKVLKIKSAGYTSFIGPEGTEMSLQGRDAVLEYMADHYDWAVAQLQEGGTS